MNGIKTCSNCNNANKNLCAFCEDHNGWAFIPVGETKHITQKSVARSIAKMYPKF